MRIPVVLLLPLGRVDSLSPKFLLVGLFNRSLSGDVAFLLFTFLGFQKAQVLFGHFESVQIDFYLDPSLPVFSGAHA